MMKATSRPCSFAALWRAVRAWAIGHTRNTSILLTLFCTSRFSRLPASIRPFFRARILLRASALDARTQQRGEDHEDPLGIGHGDHVPCADAADAAVAAAFSHGRQTLAVLRLGRRCSFATQKRPVGPSLGSVGFHLTTGGRTSPLPRPFQD